MEPTRSKSEGWDDQEEEEGRKKAKIVDEKENVEDIEK